MLFFAGVFLLGVVDLAVPAVLPVTAVLRGTVFLRADWLAPGFLAAVSGAASATPERKKAGSNANRTTSRRGGFTIEGYQTAIIRFWGSGRGADGGKSLPLLAGGGASILHRLVSGEKQNVSEFFRRISQFIFIVLAQSEPKIDAPQQVLNGFPGPPKCPFRRPNGTGANSSSQYRRIPISG